MIKNKTSQKNKFEKVIDFNNLVQERSHTDLEQNLNEKFLNMCIENSKRKDENNINCITENGICLHFKFKKLAFFLSIARLKLLYVKFLLKSYTIAAFI